jgi:hypothetical protein
MQHFYTNHKMKLLYFATAVVISSVDALCSHKFDCRQGEWCCLEECISNRITACEKSNFDGALFVWVFVPFVLVTTCVGVFLCAYCHVCCWAATKISPPNYMLVGKQPNQASRNES